MRKQIRTFKATFLCVILFLSMSGLAAAGGSLDNTNDYSGHFMVRIGGSAVAPDTNATVLNSGAVIAGADADVSTEIIPSATLTYFFNNNWAIELFCCFAKHDVDGKGTLNGVFLGDTWIFPPALTLQYHFNSINGFKPYVGAGLQYIAFFDESNSNLSGNPRLDIDDAFGFTLQAGVDYELGKGWYLNADVKKTWIELDAKWKGSNITADLDLDPWIISAGFGYRFDLF